MDEGASKTEEWFVKNQNYIIGALAAIALVVLGYLGYNKLFAEPQAKEAMNEVYQAKKYFEDIFVASLTNNSILPNKISLFSYNLVVVVSIYIVNY